MAAAAVIDTPTAAPGFLSDMPPPIPFRSVTKRTPGGKSCGSIAVATAAAAMVALLYLFVTARDLQVTVAPSRKGISSHTYLALKRARLRNSSQCCYFIRGAAIHCRLICINILVHVYILMMRVLLFHSGSAAISFGGLLKIAARAAISLASDNSGSYDFDPTFTD